jgi:2-hydroxychromene-2-carboxylate isomerase
MAGSSTARATQAAFYFDLASPEAYLAAERVNHALDSIPEWIPIHAASLPGPTEGFDAWRCEADALAYRDTVERRAAAAGLQPVRWPDPFPFDSAFAMRVAWYAKSIGRTIPFAQAAFRQAFAGGRALEVHDNVLIAASACEMHPTAVLKAAQLRSVGAGLSAATELAVQRGVRDVPALWTGDGRVVHGEAQMLATPARAPA